jgi:hypothetical protein
MGRLQNNPSTGWVHPKLTHACPLAWGNRKYLKRKRRMIKIQIFHHAKNIIFKKIL